jgi:hypothetical protein
MTSEENKGVELSEQTPLKSDTDAGVTETAAEGGPTTTVTEKKRWFFTKKVGGHTYISIKSIIQSILKIF